MDRSEFSIGTEFRCGGKVFRCTDVGTRTVIAIRVDHLEIATARDRELSKVVLMTAEAEKEGWFNGPPYAVLEMVFDEDDFEGCEPV